MGSWNKLSRHATPVFMQEYVKIKNFYVRGEDPRQIKSVTATTQMSRRRLTELT
jgi:hypothetical protein